MGLSQMGTLQNACKYDGSLLKYLANTPQVPPNTLPVVSEGSQSAKSAIRKMSKDPATSSR